VIPQSGKSASQQVLFPLILIGSGMLALLVAGIALTTHRSWSKEVSTRSRTIINLIGYSAESLDEPGELQRLIGAVSADRDIKLVVVATGVPLRVIASSRPSWIGSLVSDLPKDAAISKPIEETMRTRAFTETHDKEQKLLLCASPIELTHFQNGSLAPQTGAILLQMEDAGITESVRSASLATFLGTTTLLAILLAAGFILINRRILFPLRKLSEAIRNSDETAFEPGSEVPSEIDHAAQAWLEARTQSRKAIRELENQKFALDEHAIVSVTDLKGIIRYANDKFCSISGYASAELVGRSHNIISSGIHPASFFRNLWTTISEGRAWHGEICNRAKTGHFYWMDSTIIPLVDETGTITGFISIHTDITDRVSQNNKLLELNQTLENQSLLAQDLANKANAANEAKSEFLANMSHEIRTPMNGVMGMTELLLMEELTPSVERKAKIILESSKSLLSVINDILDFSKIEAGKLEIRPVVFHPRLIVASIQSTLEHRLQEKGLAFKIRIGALVPTELIGDPDRIRQILLNLISNAEKFTSKGSIAVLVDLVRLENLVATLHVEVVDTGIGIPEDKIPELFKSFSQIDGSLTRKYGGTGLGLAISKQLVLLMNGEIGVESEVGKGSKFWFRIETTVTKGPDSQSNDPLSLLSESSHPGLDRESRILVVDDNEVNRMICGEILENLGMECTFAEDGVAALEILRSQYFDLILMDLQMPRLGGIEATLRIRSPKENLPSKDTPIIAITANAMPSDIEASHRAGMNGFLSKPFLMEQFRKILATHLPSPNSAQQNPS
jgi:PAS domain S-box-containing protein